MLYSYFTHGFHPFSERKGKDFQHILRTKLFLRTFIKQKELTDDHTLGKRKAALKEEKNNKLCCSSLP